MAELTFQCQVCRTALTADESQVGTLVRCPLCKATLRVPAPARAEVVEPSRPQQQKHQPVAAGAASSGAGPATASSVAATGYAPPLPKRVYVPAGLIPQRSGVTGGKRYGFNCVYCSSRLEANESMAAQEGQCPTCGNSIVIPILDRYGRLIDPITQEILKQDPHPVHAYAAAGERAPKIIRLSDGGQAIECPRCSAVSPVTVNNCKSCGMPFTMEGTTLEAAGASNGLCVASLVLGIIGIPAMCIILPSLLAVILGLVGLSQVNRSTSEASGKGMAIAGICCGSFGLVLSIWYHALR